MSVTQSGLKRVYRRAQRVKPVYAGFIYWSGVIRTAAGMRLFHPYGTEKVSYEGSKKTTWQQTKK